nr:ATP-binding protein [uncultured Acidocella sp.]
MSKSKAKPFLKAKTPRTYATGGGNATALGVNFQQSLGAILGAWMLTETTVDQRLRLGGAKIVELRLETEAPLDDVLAKTSEGGFISMQAKNNLSLSKVITSEFGKTVEQIVRQWRLCRDGNGDKGWNRPVDTMRDRFVIAVGPDSPATTRQHLMRGLEARRQIGPPILTKAQATALGNFDTCVKLAWGTVTTETITDVVIREIGLLTFVYTIDPAGHDRAAIIAALGSAVANVSDAASVLNLLERVSGDLMGSRGGIDLPHLRQDLIGRGAPLSPRPSYRDDIAALRAHSTQVESTLRAYEVVEAETGSPVGIERNCQAAINAAALTGNLLLIGEPGAGKSAVINALGRALKAKGHDVIELAVDRFSIESLEGLSAALRLRHSLVEVLEAWDGPTSGFLIIDALDASRGGPAEAAFKRLIETVIEQAGRWTVVASIRTFDLSLGRNFQVLFKGTPPDITLRGGAFPAVRHIKVPPWSDTEFGELLALSPRLGAVLSGSPEKLRELAMVPFNTRLLAELVAGGAVSGDFNKVDSQIALLNLYWEHRVVRHGMAAEVCLRAIVTEMVARRILQATRLQVAEKFPQMLDTLTGEGVLALTNQDRSVQFRHHLFFDYAASRVFLDIEQIVSGEAVFPKTDGLGLVLAPAMSFLLRGLWAEDTQHDQFWSAVSRLLGAHDCDPLIRAVAARMAAELPVLATDIIPFGRMIALGDANALAALAHIVGAVAVRLEDEPTAGLPPWVRLALELSSNPEPVAALLRMLCFLLATRTKDDCLRRDLGAAARALLQYGFTHDDSRYIATPAIDFVADTMSTDCQASAALLVQIFSDARFEKFGSQEVPALARKIAQVALADPAFAARVYREVYTLEIKDTQKTSMGTGRILNLTSNTKQDFESARWSLGEFFPKFLAQTPDQAVRAFIGAMEGYVLRRPYVSDFPVMQRVDGLEGVVLLQPDQSYIWAHDARPQFAQDGETLLLKFVIFLESGPEPLVLEAARYVIQEARLGVIWSRLFMAAANRGGALAKLAVPYAKRVEFLLATDTRKDAIDLIAAYYDQFTNEERQKIETVAINASFEDFVCSEESRRRFLQRLFGTIGRDRLATDDARAVVETGSSGDEANRRIFELTVSTMTPSENYWMDEQTRSDPTTTRMTEIINEVKKELHLETNDRDESDDLGRAMAVLVSLKAEIDVTTATDEALMDRAEGTFLQGVHKLVNSSLISRETPDQTIETILDWIEFGCTTSQPRVDNDTETNFEKFASWGSPSARIEAAELALDLTLKRADVYPRLQRIIDQMLVDPHPAVRMNAAVRLIRIWDVDRPGFWAKAANLIATEDNRAVVDNFIVQILSAVVWHGGERQVADLVLPLLDSLEGNDDRNKAIRPHLIQMNLQFWMRFGFADAKARVDAWVANPIDCANEVCEMIRWLRNACTAGLRGTEDCELVKQRSQAISLFTEVVEKAGQELAAYGDFNSLNDAQIARAQSAIQIIDTACQQLYFSSGAFVNQNGQDNQPAMTAENMRTFLAEITSVLRTIGEHSGPHTVHYMIQLLEYLIEANPKGVFDLIASTILRGNRDRGYQFEFLGADLVVKLVGRYLADHKEIFDDPQRRLALIDILETFVAAGWPAVRRLIYRLPELLK